MNKYQNRTNILLKEVINICNELLIPWFISGKSAARCYLGDIYKDDFRDIEITIRAKDVHRFMEACKKKRKRYLESFYNNPNFFGLYLKYIDTTTTMINYNEGFSCKVRGVYIKINILRCIPDNKKQRNKCINYEHLIEDTSKAYCDMSGKTTLLQRSMFRLSKKLILGYNKRLFFKLIKQYSDENNQDTALCTADGQIHFFDKNRFSNLLIFDGADTPLWIPEKPEELFGECFGEKWRECVFEKIKEGRPGDVIYNSIYFLSSLDVSYKPMVKELKKLGVNKAFFKRLHRMKKIADNDSEFMVPINNAWNNANRAGDLWNVHEYYKEKKKNIEYLYEIGELGELIEQYKYYDEIVKKHAKNDMGFKYDNDLWEIYLYIKQFTSSIEEVEKIKEMANGDSNLQIQIRNMENILNESI